MALLPVATYGLQVPPGDKIVPALTDLPATFRITMAAIDPSEPVDSDAAGDAKPRATLKLIRQPEGSEDDKDSKEYMRALLAESDSEDESESEEEANGGPSDPAKSKKARKATALQQLMDSLDNADEEMEDAPSMTNGKASKKGKSKATGDEEDKDSEGSSDDEEEIDIEEFVLCTLDPEKSFQQPLDITIGENEHVFFKVTGTHSIYLTGNYVIPQDNGHKHHHEDSDSEDEIDNSYLSYDDELEPEFLEDESDDLDALENPRFTEVDSDDEAPKLVSSAEKKGKNKRSADQIEEGASLDDIMAKTLKPEAAEEQKLSKKQLKKLKKNNGEAAPAKADDSKKTESPAAKSESADKKVQFAKNLVQGPTGSAEKVKVPVDNTDTKGKPALGVKTVKGVKIDDKKLGTGPACKKGNKVGMRYIGKLENGKVFDSNTKGKPFGFKLGSGEVIRGWDIGVAGMSVGGERRLTIPASLAYGSKGAGQIPGNATLIFDIKLLEMK
ncbi:unnamed protein product [Diplocarpon coronariae]|uniref:peptidylprolyl isomerase n=1 Tax=Diplocarpon coronariae TaxID=2795749 RepID=A0A218YZW2_9HELO|nr:hypothetical protein B2J93_270 [Marssonina coronariae]